MLCTTEWSSSQLHSAKHMRVITIILFINHKAIIFAFQSQGVNMNVVSKFKTLWNTKIGFDSLSAPTVAIIVLIHITTIWNRKVQVVHTSYWNITLL